MVGFVEMNVPCCDFTHTDYNRSVKGAGALCEGATGRWCVVMYAGPDYLKKIDAKVLSYKEAVDTLVEMGVPLYLIDF